jgi:hypothetical protein
MMSTSQTQISDDALLEAFEAGALQAGQFSHGQHVRVGYLYLTRMDFGRAVSRVSRGLKALVEKLGVADKYNETITVAFMALINERLGRDGDPGGWAAFARANPDLLDVDILYRYYDRAELFSDVARRTFVMSGGPRPGQASRQAPLQSTAER